MHKGRLEAFSDGVFAIIITIMVLELKVPEGQDIYALYHVLPVFVCYVLSFILVGMYWNNHHHLLQAVQKVNGPILWANMHLLFWLSLVPFATAWMGENGFGALPVALYGVIQLLCGVAYTFLTNALVSHHGSQSALAVAMGSDWKGKISLALYSSAVPIAFWNSWVSFGLFSAVAVLWFLPDRRIERHLNKAGTNQGPKH